MEYGDSKPLTKLPPLNRLCSASWCLWNFLHLLPRQGPVKQTEVSNLLGARSTSSPIPGNEICGLLSSWSCDRFTQDSVECLYCLDTHGPILRSQPSSTDPLTGHPLWSIAHSVWPMFLLQKQLSRALRTYERRIEWLSLASRRIWGTVCEKRYLLSSSVLVFLSFVSPMCDISTYPTHEFPLSSIRNHPLD